MKRNALALTLITALFVLLLVEVQSVKSSPKTITVPDDYSSIQDAVDYASAGDTVFVRKGNYTLRGLVEGLTINKSISLIGESKQNTILRQTPYRYNRDAIKISADNVAISGFTVEEGTIHNIGIDGSGCKITNNYIINSYNNGIDVNGKDNVISGNTISDNPVFGIYMSANNSVISLNNIANNGFAGIIIDSCKTVTVNQNTIAGNGNPHSNVPAEEKGGLILRWTGSFHIQENNITNNNGFGIQFGEGCNNAIISNNNIIANQYGVYLLNYVINPLGIASAGSGNQVYWNNIEGNGVNAIVEHTYDYTLDKSAGDVGNSTDIVSWDNGKVGNYWGDYSGQGSYVIDQNNVDHHPLTQQVDINSIAPIPTLNTVVIVTVMVAVVAVVIVGLLVYFKKRKHRAEYTNR